MEIKAELLKPYTDKQRMDFIVEQNHKLGYEIRQVETTYEVEEEMPYTEIETEEIQVPVLDEEGNPVLDEDGNQIVETKTVEKEVVKYKTEIVEKTGYNLEAWGYTDEEKQEQGKERIKKLTCTKRVFALMLQELGIDYLTQLKPLIESNSQAQLEWDLCIELLRENPMIDKMAEQLGVTSEQIDALFLYANGELSKDDFELYKPKQEVTDENTTNTTDIPNEVDTEESRAENTDTDTLGEQETVRDTADTELEATDTL